MAHVGFGEIELLGRLSEILLEVIELPILLSRRNSEDLIDYEPIVAVQGFIVTSLLEHDGDNSNNHQVSDRKVSNEYVSS